jgi:outer membrane scaffolding protein for murein synthesis (MipA/OmpV family)
LALCIGEVQARDEPLWEAGLGIAGLHLPDYRGSIQSRNYAFPVPYFIYRGEIFKADREGVRGSFLKSDRVDLNLSLGASLPVSSSKNEAREGMPDLRASIEVGPSLEVNLWALPDRRVKLDLRLPLRAGMTLESSPRYTGLQFFPHLNIDVHDPGGLRGWNLGLLAGPVFTDVRHNRYFYEVAPAFATPSRPAYEPPGGYAGAEFIVALSRRFPGYWLGAFARYDTLHGAAFEESPLVTSRRYAAAGIGVSGIFGESTKRVPVNDYGVADR